MAKKTYVVKDKDNLASLSKALGVSIRELQQANGIRNLTPGQTLVVPSSRNPDIQKTKKQAGIYTTGEDERKTVTVDGQQIRLGPNSTLDTRKPRNSRFGQFIDMLMGRGQPEPSGTTSIRGAVPNPYKGASPTKYGGIGATGTVGGYIPTTYPANSRFNPVTPQVDPFSPLQNYLRQNALGLTQNMYPVNSRFNPVNTAQQTGIDPFSPQQNLLRQQALGLIPTTPNLSSQQQLMRQRGYQPPTANNAWNARNNIPTSAPFLTAANLANPTYGNASPAPTSNYGNYAAGNKSYSGQAKTAQESYQQGNRNVKTRWWINRGGDNEAEIAARAAAEYAAAQQAAMEAIKLNTGTKQKATWRV
jgi:LysM repeat protein